MRSPEIERLLFCLEAPIEIVVGPSADPTCIRFPRPAPHPLLLAFPGNRSLPFCTTETSRVGGGRLLSEQTGSPDDARCTIERRHQDHRSVDGSESVWRQGTGKIFMFDESPYRPELETALLAVTEAGAAVHDLYDRNAAATYTKGDGSPVTDADLAADRIIRRILSERHPDVPILTEEGVDDEARLLARRVWIADPIDGTNQFVRRTGNFDVLLALVEDSRPVVAASFQPPTGRLCLAAVGCGSWLGAGAQVDRRVVLTADLNDPPTIGTSVWFGGPDNLPLVERIASALGGRAGTVSEIGFTPRRFVEPGAFDLLIGLRTDGDQMMASEWDFAVGDLFLHEAGGQLTDLDGQPFAYNKRRPVMANGLVASLNPSLHARAVQVLADLRGDVRWRS